ncbi:MAG: hypothetical protein HQK54_01435 [Oligoflexales bacterium]|nr:hypothetical protein [Oligoflexales bacterium]
MGSFLFFFPIGMIHLYNTFARNGKISPKNALFPVLFISMAFCGARLEHIFHGVFFIGITMIVFFFHSKGESSWRKNIFFLVGFIAVILALNAWHISLVVDSVKSSFRISHKVSPIKLFNYTMWKWILINLIYQKYLFFAILNYFVFYFFKTLRKKWNIHIYKIIFPTIMLCEAILYKYFFSLFEGSSFYEYITLNFGPSIGEDLLWSSSGLISFLVLLIFFYFENKKIFDEKLFKYICILFFGFYVVQYTFQYWPVNTNWHSFFSKPFLSSIIALGVLNLWRKNRPPILAILVIYHLIGEEGSFILFELFNFPWNLPRASLVEITFQVIIILESLFLIWKILEKGFESLNIGMTNIIFFKKAWILLLVIFSFLYLEDFMLPSKKVILTDSNSYEKVYLKDFPFGETPEKYIYNNPNARSWVEEALKNSRNLREKNGGLNKLERTFVDDNVLIWSLYFKFMPSFSQTLNTAPIYSSEVPRPMKELIYAAKGKELNIQTKYHPEMNPIFIAYFKYNWDPNQGDPYDYINQTSVMPHQVNDKVIFQILAEENSGVTRIFAAKNVKKVPSVVEEYRVLRDELYKNGNISGLITTSDTRFVSVDSSTNENKGISSNIEIKKDEAEIIQVHIKNTEKVFLALMDMWDKNWIAFINKRETIVYKGYISNRFIEVPAGDNQIEFVYKSDYFNISKWVSAFMWVGIILAIFIFINRSKRFFVNHFR